MKYCPCGQTISPNKSHCFACFEKHEYLYLMMVKAARPVMPVAHAARLAELHTKFATTDARQHVISFAYGNSKLHNPGITREMIEQQFDQLKVAGELKAAA